MSRKTELKHTYEGLKTQALLELHGSGGLTDEAYDALEKVLRGRLVNVPARPSAFTDTQARRPEWQQKAMKTASHVAQIFAVVGIATPSLLLCLDHFAAIPLQSTAGLMLPAMCVLIALDWRGGIGPELLVALSVNATASAGVGWLVGYGWSRS